MIAYRRKFHLSSSHFNGEECYTRWEEIWKQVVAGHIPDVPVFIDRLLLTMQNMHGHDFIVSVDVEIYAPAEKVPMVVEDEKLEEVIMEFDRVNWSVMEGVSFFPGEEDVVVRATTERVADIMCDRVVALVKRTTDPGKFIDSYGLAIKMAWGRVVLSIQETKDIIVLVQKEIRHEQ